MIYLAPSFVRRYKKLTPGQQSRVDAAILKFSLSVGHPHLHAGIGLRHYGKYLEFRAGLDLRILAAPERGDFTLMCVGDHEEIRAYVKGR